MHMMNKEALNPKTDKAATETTDNIETKPDEAAPQTERDDVSKKIADLEAQVNEWRDKCFRAVAELDNARKRFA